METKREIRERILRARSSLLPSEVTEESERITEEIVRHPRFCKADTLLIYVDFRNEVQTGQLMELAWKMGKTVGVPRVSGRQMEFYEITSREDLEPGKFGILEPKKNCPIIKPEDAECIAVIPGVAFDKKGNRIGYGGGYYDRYFADKQGIYKIAAAFQMQIVPEIESEKFDIKMDCVI